jgi:hypothetical protein
MGEDPTLIVRDGNEEWLSVVDVCPSCSLALGGKE